MNTRKYWEHSYEQEGDISDLIEVSMRYFQLPFASIDYDRIVDDLLRFSRASYVMINTLNENKNTLTIRKISDLGQKAEKVQEILGTQVVGNEWDLTPEEREILREKRLIRFDDLHEAMFQKIPYMKSKMIQEMLNIEALYLMGMCHDKEILGSVVLGWSPTDRVRPLEKIELLVHLLGIVILRKKAEEELSYKEQELHALNEEMHAMNEELEASLEQLTAVEAELRNNYDVLQKKEKDLQESEERWQFVFESSDVCGWDWNLQTKEVIYSESSLKLFGYGPEEKLRIEDTQDRVHPADLSYVRQMLSKHFRGENKVYETVHRVKRKDGNYQWILDRGKVIRWGEDGQPLRMVGAYMDFTERKKMEDSLARQKQIVESLVKHSPDAIAILDKNLHILSVNDRFMQVFGYTQQECAGVHIDSLIVDQNNTTQYEEANAINELAQDDMEVSIETVRRHKNGSLISVLIRGCPTIVGEEIIGYHAFYTDITERKKTEEKIKYLSYHDKLTGLYNRAYFEEKLSELGEGKWTPVSIIIGDVNGLKLTNDVFGHLEGDKLLINIAQILKRVCPDDCIVARWGGDEFAIILLGKDEKQTNLICEKIQKACEEAEKDPIQISIALGWSTRSTGDRLFHEMIKEAEEKMYRHKLLENKSTRSNIIASLQRSLHERSFETEEHGQRLRAMGLKLGKKAGLNGTQLDELSLLAILHDIGKIGVSDLILKKPGRLNDEEWEEMKKHPQIGYRIAKTSQELFHIAEYILSHHERWDGKGYPLGLKGEEIPRLSRILAIIDSYDAMTNTRVYQKAVSHERAIQEIKRCAGDQFDPELVVLFLEILEEERGR